jgi:lipoyl(octanoyl) transferase
MKTKFLFLGKTDYQECLNLQRNIFNKKKSGILKDDYVIITEHNPIYTLGKTTKEEDLPVESIADIVQLERGGSITFHGDGQIVVYPILNLLNRKLSVKKYIYTLEEIILKTLNDIGIKAYRKDRLTGVFTDKGKIGFIGVYISKYISMHGFSLNFNVDKHYFYNIKPCGLDNKEVANVRDFGDASKNQLLNYLYKHLRNYL